MEFSEKEEKLVRFFVEREGEGVLEVIRDVDFFDSGMMDSLDLVSLAVHMEKQFGRTIDLTSPATLAAARRFDSLIKLVE